ncbi:MAG: hypothetical protein OYH77_08395 [Pseudomonadota bacterium]|nr:hypothetical protein [Pseudomonadota bacterium]
MKIPILLVSFSMALPLLAEPWLGIRFAQNCAACHAPGRINLPAIQRRCTLSCQGCHVSPQGGGLRSFYGKWNENRWLRSFAISLLKPKSSFAPTKQQLYGKPQTTQSKQSKAQQQMLKKRGYPLVVGKQSIINAETSFKRDGLEYQIAKDNLEFLRQIPQQDPYRLFTDSKIDGGGGFRYQLVHLPQRGATKASTYLFLMSADLALRWRPMYRNLHVVFEQRGIGFPQRVKSLKKSFIQARELLETSRTRSLYLLVDNLPFNSYVMAGLYRPLFGGNPSPDHTTLMQKLWSTHLGQTGSYSSRFRGLSIGTAPNVPYANLHFIIRDESGRYDKQDRTRGVAGNVGLRFVTLGLNSTYSFWYTANKTDAGKKSTLANSASVAAQLWRSTLMLEYMNLRTNTKDSNAAETSKTAKMNTHVVEVDTYTRVWREFYLLAQYALAHHERENEQEMKHSWYIGTRAFLMAGIDVSLRYAQMRADEEKDAKQSLTAQLHFYF